MRLISLQIELADWLDLHGVRDLNNTFQTSHRPLVPRVVGGISAVESDESLSAPCPIGSLRALGDGGRIGRRVSH
jgi:hypothetical protein